jgi:hypothetical protein
MIRSITDINIKNITFIQPELVSKNRIHIGCQYDGNNGIFVQTPLSTIYSLENYMNIGFPNIDHNPEVIKFVKLIDSIDNYIFSIQKDLWRQIGKNTRDKKFYPSIRWNNNKTNVYMNLQLQKQKIRNNSNKIILTPFLDVYDSNKKHVSIDYIEPFCSAYNIIYFEYIWISLDTKSMGLHWSVLQSKIYKNIIRFNECMIKDDEYDNPFLKPEEHCQCCSKKTAIVSNNDEYDKYIKMKKMGIPIEAIKLKIKQDGLDISVFENLNNKTADITPIKTITNSNTTKISANMLSAVILKKASPIEKEIKAKELIPLQLREKYTPPSKDDILNILNRLKKVDK